jgi:hypothetical protein
MTKADDTRVAYATYAANSGFTAEQRTVFTEDDQPTNMRVLSLDEAQAYAVKEAAASSLADEQAKAAAKSEARFLQQKQRRYGPMGYGAKTTVPRKPGAIKPVRFLTVADLGSTKTPWLRLSGKWLEQAGFPVNSRVKVEVSEGRLTITPEVAAT